MVHWHIHDVKDIQTSKPHTLPRCYFFLQMCGHPVKFVNYIFVTGRQNLQHFVPTILPHVIILSVWWGNLYKTDSFSALWEMRGSLCLANCLIVSSAAIHSYVEIDLKYWLWQIWTSFGGEVLKPENDKWPLLQKVLFLLFLTCTLFRHFSTGQPCLRKQPPYSLVTWENVFLPLTGAWTARNHWECDTGQLPLP